MKRLIIASISLSLVCFEIAAMAPGFTNIQKAQNPYEITANRDGLRIKVSRIPKQPIEYSYSGLEVNPEQGTVRAMSANEAKVIFRELEHR